MFVADARVVPGEAADDGLVDAGGVHACQEFIGRDQERARIGVEVLKPEVSPSVALTPANDVGREDVRVRVDHERARTVISIFHGDRGCLQDEQEENHCQDDDHDEGGDGRKQE